MKDWQKWNEIDKENEEIICPHCNYTRPIEYDDYEGMRGSEVETKSTCHECNKPFELLITYEPTFYSQSRKDPTPQ